MKPNQMAMAKSEMGVPNFRDCEVGNAIWRFVQTGPNGEKPDIRALILAMSVISEDYEIVPLTLIPEYAWKSEIVIIKGNPVRHIEAWDAVRGEVIERLDFYAQLKGRPQ